MILPTEIPYPDISPSFDLGPLTIHWYGVMYAVGFVLAWWLGTVRARRAGSGWEVDEVSDLILWCALGVVLGGRLGYILFYGLGKVADDPLSVLRVWEGGMSFHGGLLGVLAAMWFYARRTGRRYFEVGDFVAPLVPLGLFFGRIGNFINGELWGKPSDVPWAMVFPTGGPEPRHPTMLYEALLEGLVLFTVLWLYASRRPPVRAVSGMFLVLYGVFRILVEFLRVPDAHLGYLALDWLTMGQLLSVPMVLFGAYLLWSAYRSGVAPSVGPGPGVDPAEGSSSASSSST
ncbi:prolipoprotein diacylglyceryl transferase [Ornithinimicrobium tianjinense]|uniref:Phosphatidylglycerol--prolipoprotein diacylglyceryl transferase n=1 Tax=Ornithinimicrobium tianjinense TaxID=1195761 RepID=A0A917BI29_9MICO|nr:prolipoprotein diacylglyceryl transferase [Ornithinimicrobium tianjinense]GGF45551.1 prolipoprotein diacylglyceryl transferase [Ornithinimicrobium tianjinense]